MLIKIASKKDKQYIIKNYPYTKNYIKRKGILYIACENDVNKGFAFVQSRKVFNEINIKESLILVIEVFDCDDRRKGIASMLIKKIKEDSKERGDYQIIAYYNIDNICSHKLWMKNYFGVTAIRLPDKKILGCQAIYKL